MASSRSRADQFLLAFALLLLISSPRTASGAPNTTPLSVLCNGAVYGPGDPFSESLAYVISPYPNAFAYGYAACSGVLANADCASCLRSAVGQMNTTCSHAIGARAVLVDCRVRYEQYAFVD